MIKKERARRTKCDVLITHSYVHFPRKVPIFRACKNAKFALQHPIIFGVFASPWTTLTTEKRKFAFSWEMKSVSGHLLSCKTFMQLWRWSLDWSLVVSCVRCSVKNSAAAGHDGWTPASVVHVQKSCWIPRSSDETTLVMQPVRFSTLWPWTGRQRIHVTASNFVACIVGVWPFGIVWSPKFVWTRETCVQETSSSTRRHVDVVLCWAIDGLARDVCRQVNWLLTVHWHIVSRMVRACALKWPGIRSVERTNVSCVHDRRHDWYGLAGDVCGQVNYWLLTVHWHIVSRMVRACALKGPGIEDFSKDCPGTRYGASPARNNCDVCVFLVWYVISFSILESQPSITVVFLDFPMDAGRVLHYATIAFEIPLSSELSCPSSRRRSKLPRERMHRSRQWALPRKDFHFPSRAQESMDSPITDHGKARKACRSLKADAVPSVFSFFFWAETWSLRAPVSNGMSVDYEAEKGTALRESVQLTPVGQMMKPLFIQSWRNTRGCSASEVKFVKDPPIERPTRACRPTRSVHRNRIAEKVKQYLSGCVPVDEKFEAQQAGEEEKRTRNREKKEEQKKKDSRWRCRWR